MSKHYVLMLMAALASLWTVTAVAQPCVPIDTFTSIGLFPDSLPPMAAGQAYSATLSAALPKDTVLLPGVPAFDFCKYSIVSTTPDITQLGLTYECDQPNCTYIVDHSKQLNFGCIVIQGTPTQSLDSIVVSVTAVVGSYDAGSNTCDSSSSLTFPLTVYVSKSGVVSHDSHFAGLSGLTVAPNPTAGQAIIQVDLQRTARLNVRVLDPTGREIRSLAAGEMASGTHRFSVETSTWAAGMYLIRVDVPGEGTYLTRKLIVE